MIKLLGFKRIAAIAILLGLNALAMAAYFLFVSPMLDDTTAQLEGLKSDLGQIRGKIDDEKRDAAFVNENTGRFQSIAASGLFGGQDRFEGQRILDELRKKGDISSFTLTVGEMTKLPSPDADSIGFDIMSSKVSVTQAVAALDTGIFALAQGVMKDFPGHTRIRRFEVRRTQPLDDKVMNDFSDGKDVTLVSADLDFDWITLEQKPAAPAAGGR